MRRGGAARVQVCQAPGNRDYSEPMRVRIEVEISPGAKRLMMGLGLAGLVGAVASAHADWQVDPDTWIGPGMPVSSSKLSGLVKEIDDRLVAVEGLLQPQERVFRATIPSGGGAPTDTTGNWVSSNKPTTGQYLLTFTPAFTAKPTCVASVFSGNQVAPLIECFNVATTGAECRVQASGSGAWSPAQADSTFSIICVGPHP